MHWNNNFQRALEQFYILMHTPTIYLSKSCPCTCTLMSTKMSEQISITYSSNENNYMQTYLIITVAAHKRLVDKSSSSKMYIYAGRLLHLIHTPHTPSIHCVHSKKPRRGKEWYRPESLTKPIKDSCHSTVHGLPGLESEKISRSACIWRETEWCVSGVCGWPGPTDWQLQNGSLGDHRAAKLRE